MSGKMPEPAVRASLADWCFPSENVTKEPSYKTLYMRGHSY